MEERLRYLFKRYLDNTCSREELEEFFEVVSKASHDDALRDLVKDVYAGLPKTSSPLNYVDEKGQLVINEPEWIKSPAETRRESVSGGRRTAIASMLFVAVVAVLFIFKPWQREPARTRIISSLTQKTTDRSEYKYLLLHDGTEVWLNAASSLKFPDHFDNNKREVFLSGEAYFDVKHAEETPFIIHTGPISTLVVGTAFNIKAYPNQKSVVVSVSRGKVKVSRRDNTVATLTTGQQVKVEQVGEAVVERSIPADRIAAWQEGNMVYDDETLSDIIRDIERVYNATIKVENQSMMDVKLSTSFRRDIGVEQALQVLCRLTDTELVRSSGEYHIR